MRNLIIVIADTLRLASPIDGQPIESLVPVLRTLRASGGVCLDTVASSSWTYPSHMSLLQGTAPWDAASPAVWHSRGGTRPSCLAELWGRTGGISAAFTANSSVRRSNGILAGYDYVDNDFARRVRRTVTFGSGLFDLSSNVTVGSRLPNVEIKSAVHPLPMILNHPRETRRSGSRQGMFSFAYHELMSRIMDSRHTVRGLRRYLRKRRTREPLHVLVNLMEAHEPYRRSEQAKGLITHSALIPTGNYAYHATYLNRTKSDPTPLRQAYTNALARLNQRLEELIGVLRQTDTLSESMVLVTSDHGQCFGEHGFYGHSRYLHDELIRIPCILWSSDGQLRRQASSVGPTLPLVDHRHLNGALAEWIKSERTSDLLSEIPRAVSKTEGAISYVELQPIIGLSPFKRGPTQRKARILNRELSIELRAPAGKGAQVIDEPTQPSETVRSMLETYHGTLSKVFDEKGVGEIRPSIGEVLSRIESWGYG